MITSKSPKAIASIAYEATKKALPAYTHIFSPKKFTQHQLTACLVLKAFFKTDYRGIVAILKDSHDLRDILELTDVPHFTTLQKASREVLKKKNVRKLIEQTARIAKKKKILKTNTHILAIDSTGLESGHTSRYFVKRRERGSKNLYQTTTYKKWPKLALGCDLTHIITGALSLRGPSVDIVHFKKLFAETQLTMRSRTLLADAGYDSEESHRFTREEHSIKSIIPPKIGRQTNKLPKGKYRRLMATRFNKKLYGQRWQVETVMSMIKRNLGESIFSKSYWSQSREMMLKVIAHNVTILWLKRRYA
jgi:hypothetical protein